MHKKKRQMAMFAMAAFVSINLSSSALADTISNTGAESAAEEILSGMGEEEEMPEEILTGTEDQEDVQTLKGISDSQERESSEIQDALRKAESYLQNTNTSPVVGTISGEWSVLAMARGGYLTDSAKNAYLSNLYQTLNDKKGVLHKTKYTEYSRVVLALSAINVSPLSVNGYNLLEPLSDFEKVSGQGINGSIYALMAFDAKKYDIPELKNEKIQTTREGLIDDILKQELAGGGWTLSGNMADPDVTAMAVQCLAPYMSEDRVNASVNRGIEKLAAMQEEDGGYINKSALGNEEPVKNLESTAQVVIALSAVDVNLIQQDKFMKNGKTLLDELLRFQNDDGSFVHAIGGKADSMATDQGTLALVAWSRAVNGQSRLYDMTDLGSNQGEEQETQEKIEAFRNKMQELPKKLTIAYKDKVYSLKTELDFMKSFDEKEKFEKTLTEYIEEIAKQEEDINKLDQRIWEEIDPLQITLKNKAVVESLLEDFQKIPEQNRGYLKRGEDLKKAEIIVNKLEEGILAKELFEISKESGRDYVHEEDGYSLRIKAKKINAPADMKTAIDIKEENGMLQLGVLEEGNLPGEIEISVVCTLKDGIYMLYNGSKQQQWVSVQNNKASFDLTQGGEYFLKKAETGEEEKALSGTQTTGGTPTASGSTSKQTSKTKTAQKASNVSTSNTIQAEIKDGVVEKKEFEAIKEKDKNLKINSKTDQNKEYILTINGKDIKNAKDMKIGVKEGSKYQKEIEQLAENPYIFSFEEEGDFPGKMQMEITTNQEDGQYLLMKYNDEEKKADYIQKVKVEDKKTKFIIEKGGDYFIAKKVKTKSLNEIEEEEKEIKEEVEDTEADVDTEPVEEEFLTGTKEESALPGVLLAGGGVLALAGLGVGIWYVRKRK